jgi:serine/threonine protein kinase
MFPGTPTSFGPAALRQTGRVPIPEQLGRLRQVRRLGRGGFATVWLYHDEELDSEVAVKALADNLAEDSDIRERFLAESRLLRRANSEHVVQVYDIGEVDGTPYFVMSYADRGSLGDVMKTGRLPSYSELSDLIGQAAKGLSVLHALGIVHRDIKPENLLFTSTAHGGQRLMVADLGVAKSLTGAAPLTQSVGTPAFMAPEQMDTQIPLDPRADIHGLGAVAYALVTGKAPQPRYVADQPVPPPSSIRPVPPEVEQVIMRALEYRRENRWPDVLSFTQALDHACRTAEARGMQPQGAFQDDATQNRNFLSLPPGTYPGAHSSGAHPSGSGPAVYGASAPLYSPAPGPHAGPGYQPPPPSGGQRRAGGGGGSKGILIGAGVGVLALIAGIVGFVVLQNDDDPKADDPKDPETSKVVADPAPKPEAGQCRQLDPEAVDALSDDTPVVDCDEDHNVVTFYVGEYGEGSVPDNDVAAEGCTKHFDKAVGGTNAEVAMSSFRWLFFQPDNDAWTEGERWYRCDLAILDAESAPKPLPPGDGPYLTDPLTDEHTACVTASGDRTTCADTHAFRAVGTFKATGSDLPNEAQFTAQVAKKCPKPNGWATWPGEIGWEAGQRTVVCYKSATD